MYGKRKYKSGAQKRAEKRRKTENSLLNTSAISTFMQKKDESERDNKLVENNDLFITSNTKQDSASTTTSTSELEDDPFSENAEKNVNPQILPCSNNDVTYHNDENLTPVELRSSFERKSSNDNNTENLAFDTTRKFPTDRGHFTENITHRELKIQIMHNGPCRPTGSFEYEDENGNTKVNFSARYYNKYVDNISVPRLWLCYSAELRKPYCEICWLFADRSSPNYENNRGWINGVSGDLHNMLDKIKRHEACNMHIQATAVYMRWKSGKTINEDNEKEIRNNALFWVKVLDRIITIILTLSALTLAFRGHDEHVHDDICEGGNFLGMVYMMAQFDEILGKVISLPARATKYLSPKIQNELIQLLAKTVTNSLVEKINASPFWALILDSTSDITRIDQLSVILRWVEIDGDRCNIEESFLGFVKLNDATAEGITSTVREFLQSLGINFSKIRGQGYDGASVMSGIHAGVQTLIKNMVTSPVPFVHCGSHNLNLVINDAVNSVVENENFFGLLRDVFSFFASSLNRWRELGVEAENGSLTLKKLCTTRWSSRINAVRAVRDRYPHIMRLLARLSLTSSNKAERDDAKKLKKNIDKLEFVIFIVMWERILRAINSASRELQSPKIDLFVASRLLNCALSELVVLRSSWSSVLLTATALAQSWGSSVTIENRRNHKTKRFFDELSTDQRLCDPQEAFKVNVFYQTVDNAIMQLQHRFEGQKMVASLFSCLYPPNMSQLKSPKLEAAAEAILTKYPKDFTDELVSEFRSFVNEFRKEIAERQSVIDLIHLMLESRVSSSFSQVYKLLILFATIPVTVATAERSFSKLKLIKTYLRSQMSQERLAGLAILSIENKQAKRVDKRELIQRFANANARRKEHIGV